MCVALLITACTGPVQSAEPSAEATGAQTPAPSVTTGNPTSTASASALPPTPTPSQAPASAQSFTWSTAGTPLAGEIASVIGDGDRFVAAGINADGQVAFVSSDGLSWQQLPVPPPTGIIEPDSGLPPDYATRASLMGPLVRLDDTLYSFGAFYFNDFFRTTAWRWTDGQAWAYITSSNPFFSDGRVFAATSGGGALAVSRLDTGITFSGADSTVWSWRPTTSWVASNLDTADPRRVLVTGLAWHADTFLATGHVTTGDETASVGAPLAWTSSDGTAWTEIAGPAVSGPLCGLAPDPEGDGMLAIGVEATKASVWSWAASSGWIASELPGAPGMATSQGMPIVGVCQLVEVAGRSVALLGPTDGPTRAWTRAAGAWLAGDPLPVQGAKGAAALGDTLVVLESVFNPATLVTTTTVHVGKAQP